MSPAGAPRAPSATASDQRVGRRRRTVATGRSMCRGLLVAATVLGPPVGAVDAALPEPLGTPTSAATRTSPLRIPEAATPVDVDGVLDDAAWERALAIALPYEFAPAENSPAPVRTVAYVTYDRSNVYFAFRACDPDTAGMQAHLSDRDSIWRDDQLGLEIDTFNDERRSYSIFINPLGIQEDAVTTADGKFDFGWDAIWDAATHIFEWGYSAEIAIPFSSIRFQRSDGPQVWGLNVMRAYVRDKRHDIGAVTIDRNNSCRHCQFLKVEGFEHVEPGHNLEITPTVTALGTQERPDFPHGSLGSQDREASLGATAQWGLTPNLTLAGTVNPDFSQIEADAVQVDINEPFALFYPEKRPFFTEGADFFGTPLDIVHTRTVRDPSWGVRLTGKEGRHTVGGFLVQDELTNLIFPGPEGSEGTSLSTANTSAIGRYAHDFGRRLTVGAVATGREGKDYFNRVLGADATLRLSGSDRLEAQLLSSSTRYPDPVAREHAQPEGTFADTAVSVNYDHSSRHAGWWGVYEKIGDGFRSDLGFIPRVGYRDLEVGAERRWNAESDRWWSRLVAGGRLRRSDAPGGGSLGRSGEVFVNYQGTLQSFFSVTARRSRETFEEVEFDKIGFELGGQVKPVPSLEIGFAALFGDHIDYARVRLGHRRRIRPRVAWSVGKHLEVRLEETFERMTVEGDVLYDAALTEALLSYQFDARTFLRGTLHYTVYDYGPIAATPGQDSRTLFGQLLFSYKVNPRTVVFVGYAQNGLGTEDYRVAVSDRTLFVKLGYAWLR